MDQAWGESSVAPHSPKREPTRLRSQSRTPAFMYCVKRPSISPFFPPKTFAFLSCLENTWEHHRPPPLGCRQGPTLRRPGGMRTLHEAWAELHRCFPSETEFRTTLTAILPAAFVT